MLNNRRENGVVLLLLVAVGGMGREDPRALADMRLCGGRRSWWGSCAPDFRAPKHRSFLREGRPTWTSQLNRVRL